MLFFFPLTVTPCKCCGKFSPKYKMILFFCILQYAWDWIFDIGFPVLLESLEQLGIYMLKSKMQVASMSSEFSSGFFQKSHSKPSTWKQNYLGASIHEHDICKTAISWEAPAVPNSFFCIGTQCLSHNRYSRNICWANQRTSIFSRNIYWALRRYIALKSVCSIELLSLWSLINNDFTTTLFIMPLSSKPVTSTLGVWMI